eukprot:10817950-Ditylum_brightwellii.AAC.1
MVVSVESQPKVILKSICISSFVAIFALLSSHAHHINHQYVFLGERLPSEPKSNCSQEGQVL